MKFFIGALLSVFFLSAPAFAQSKSQHTIKDYEMRPHCGGLPHDFTQKRTDVIRKGKVIGEISQPAEEIMDNKQRKRIKDGIYTGRGERNNILEKCNNHNPENVDKWSVHCPLTSTYFDYVVLYCDTREECIDTALRECIPK